MLKFYVQPLQDPEKFFPLSEIWNGMVTMQEDFAHACDDTSALQEELLRALGSATRLYLR